MILTSNEAANIRRTVERLLWAPRILVVDSFSSDETLAMLRDYPQIEVVQQPFVDFASQCNFGLTQVTTPWVLSLDADYRAFVNPNWPERNFEGLLTAVYQYQIRDGWTLQPNFQYIIHPGGGATNPSGPVAGRALKNAAVLGIRTTLKF